tara:strand:- start:436 stop:1029 length:594 start_codon:yes stop_codon:yes gene_type:complete
MAFFSPEFQTTLAPKSKGDYCNPSSITEGSPLRFAILSPSPLEGFEIWFEKPDGTMTKRISAHWPDAEMLSDYETEVGGKVVDRDGKKAIKACTSFFIWDFDSEAVRLFSANQKTLIGEMLTICADPDYEDLSKWDFKLARSGKGTDTKYHVNIINTKRENAKVAAQVTAAWAEAQAQGYNLEALYYGGNPFSAAQA